MQEQQQQEVRKPRYTPDRWVLLKITSKDTGEVHQRVFGGWFGGFAHGDSWRLNSGVADVHEFDDYFLFESASGKEYLCRKYSQGTEGMSMYMQNVLQSLIDDCNKFSDVEIVKV